MQTTENDICGATTKSGGTCKNAPVKGRERCRMHGGNQPRGSDNPNYKHGMYSRFASESLSEVLDSLEGMDPEELTRVDNELRLLQALIMKSRAIEDGTGDLNDLDTISKVIERLIKSKQRAVALRIEENRLVPAADIQLFLNWMEELLMDRISHDKAHDIMNELSNFKISDHEN